MNTNESNISHAQTEVTDVKIAVPRKAQSTRPKNLKNKVVEDSLRSLKLKPKDHAILHSIGLRTLQDVVIVEHRKLQGQMPKKQISEIKRLARSK